ncbi:MAG: recombinase family protein, partial [Chloroflexia bacterium]|nr:recombinase family protein [Chloroflexia bacterium]
IYTRVSSTGQEGNSSLTTQEEACRRWSHERDLPVVSVAREVWSGTDRHRPELDALLNDLVPGDVVLVYALDRLSRSQVDTAILIDRIEAAGASLALVTEDFEKSATGVFLRNAKAFAAELEREKIAERTARGKRARVESGKPLVGKKPPYGYRWRDDRDEHGKPVKLRLELDAATAPVVRRIVDMALAGQSLRRIGKALEADAIPSPDGNSRWNVTTIRRILLSPTVSGTVIAWREIHERKPNGAKGYRERPARDDERMLLPGIAPAIATPEEQAAVRVQLDINAARAIRNNPHPEATLLRGGFARCGHCGRAMKVNNAGSGRPGSPPRYYCDGPDCARPTISANLIDSPVWESIATVLQDPSIIEREVDRHRADGGLDRDLAAIERQLVTVAEKQTRTARAIAAVADDDAAAPLLAELPKLAERKKALRREREDLTRRVADREVERVRVRSLAAWCQHVSANLPTLTYADRRNALEAFGVQVRVWRPDATDENGAPRDRWSGTMQPIGGDAIVFSSTRRMTGASSSPAAFSPSRNRRRR